MIDLDLLVQNVNALTPLTIALVALAGLVVGIAPSSFPLLSVAAGLAVGQGSVDAGAHSKDGLWRATGFALGIATIDALLGALFGFAGFAVMRALASVLAWAYALLGIVLIVTGLALLRMIRFAIPVLSPSPKPARSFFSSYLLGLPFGLSTCPACTPLLLPVVAAAAATGDPVMGAVLMLTFGIFRGIPIVVAGTTAGLLARAGQTRRFVLMAERVGAVLVFVAALYFLHQAGVYAGWLTPR